MTLSSKQVRALRAESHRLKLKPVVMIGQNGLSENVTNELDQALGHHELLKIRIPALDKKDRKDMLDSICEKIHAELIQTIGHIAVLYRENNDKQRFAKLLKG